MDEQEVVIQEEDNVGPIPRYYHEAEVARQELMIKRLFWALVAAIVLLVGTNAGWIWYESQWEDVTMTQEATNDGGGDLVLNGVARGDIYYGESKTDNQGETT